MLDTTITCSDCRREETGEFGEGLREIRRWIAVRFSSAPWLPVEERGELGRC
jgi:hypothetical protein